MKGGYSVYRSYLPHRTPVKDIEMKGGYSNHYQVIKGGIIVIGIKINKSNIQ